MPNQEHEREEIANIASTLVGLASFATLHRSSGQTAVGSSASFETKSNVQQQETRETPATANGGSDTGKFGTLPAAKIETQPRRKLPFGKEVKEKKSHVPKSNGALTVSVLTASQFNAHQDPTAKVEASTTDQGHFLSVKERNGGKEAKIKKQVKNRSPPQLGKSVLPPSTTPANLHGSGNFVADIKAPVASCQENSKQFLWNAVSHFATQGLPSQQQGSSATEPPTKKLRTVGNEKLSSASALSDENNKTIQNISPFLNGTNGYKPETSLMPNGSKSNVSGLDSILMKSHPPHYGQHSAFIGGQDFAITNRSTEMHNVKKVKKMSKKEAKKRQLESTVEPPPFINPTDPNAKYMAYNKLPSTGEITHNVDQHHNLKHPPAVNLLNGDWNRSMDSKEKPNKKGNKGKSYSPTVPVVSHPVVPGSFSSHENSSKDAPATNKPFFHPAVPPSSIAVAAPNSWDNNNTSKDHPVLPSTVKSNQHKDKYSNVQSPNLSYSQQSVNAQGSVSNPVTLQADNARDNAALLKVFQELQQGSKPDVKDPKKDSLVRNNNVNANMTPQLLTQSSSAELAYSASVGDNASYNSSQSLLTQLMNGNNPSNNADAGNQDLALKLLTQHYGTGAGSNKSDLVRSQGMSLDLGSTGGNGLSQASNDQLQYQELQKQLLFMAQLRSFGANNDRLNGAQAIDSNIADQNSAALGLSQQPLATQLLLSQLGLSGNDVNQRSMDNSALQQLMQLQQLQHVQQLLQQAEYQQPSLNDRLKQQQSLQQQLQLQQNHLSASQHQQMFSQGRGPPTPQLSAKASGDSSNVFSTLLAQALLQQQQQQQQHQGNFSNRTGQSSHFGAPQQVGASAAQQQLLQQQQSQIPLHLLAALIQKQS